MNENELRKFYLEQRDKHLEQFMAINTRAVFAVLALVVSIVLGLNKITNLNLIWLYTTVICLLFFLGTVLLTAAAVKMSIFHTSRIREFQVKSITCVPFKDDDFLIIPPSEKVWHPFKLALAGIICLVAAVLMPLFYMLFCTT